MGWRLAPRCIDESAKVKNFPKTDYITTTLIKISVTSRLASR
jgi:hypothetical protein